MGSVSIEIFGTFMGGKMHIFLLNFCNLGIIVFYWWVANRLFLQNFSDLGIYWWVTNLPIFCPPPPTKNKNKTGYEEWYSHGSYLKIDQIRSIVSEIEEWTSDLLMAQSPMNDTNQREIYSCTKFLQGAKILVTAVKHPLPVESLIPYHSPAAAREDRWVNALKGNSRRFC